MLILLAFDDCSTLVSGELTQSPLTISTKQRLEDRSSSLSIACILTGLLDKGMVDFEVRPLGEEAYKEIWKPRRHFASFADVEGFPGQCTPPLDARFHARRQNHFLAR